MNYFQLVIMKNKWGLIAGFIVGMAGFLLVFKWVFLSHIPPPDELAPGIVMMLAVLNGLLVAFLGAQAQRYLAGKGSGKK